jgi:hypothetical protein
MGTANTRFVVTVHFVSDAAGRMTGRRRRIMATKPASREEEFTWIENPDDIIVLANRSKQNFILDLPAGRYRLDAGRRMRTLRSILKHESIMELIRGGQLAIE